MPDVTAADPLARIQARLRDLGAPWPAPLFHFPSLGSTNDWLKERARREGTALLPEWTTVVAGRQSAGRGRHGRSWIAPAGNLCLSVLLRPSLAAERLGLLPLAVGVALAEAVASLGVDVRLKWPNDLLAGERKLGGILVEAVSGGERVEAAVVGIGVNVALDPGELPPELRPQVTSLRAEGAGSAGELVGELAAAALARMTVWYDALGRGRDDAVLAAWRERSLPWWGRRVEVHSGMERLHGTLQGLDPRGRLLLELEDGSTTALLSGEVRGLRVS